MYCLVVVFRDREEQLLDLDEEKKKEIQNKESAR